MEKVVGSVIVRGENLLRRGIGWWSGRLLSEVSPAFLRGLDAPGSPAPRHLDLMSNTTKLGEISGRDCEWAAFTAIQFYFSSSQLYSYRFAYLLILSCVDHISWDS